MPLTPENIVLRDKIVSGIRKAVQKLVETRAANSQSLVISVNGEIKHVPAKEILMQQKAAPK